MENNSQAIELKGIVRNQTKIGVQDGQCDDIVNLRFKDGSWRVADDGKVMLDADNGTPFNATGYSQLYVHTNVYHHLLGVKQGKLYWFANIGADGESFTFVKNTNGVPSPVEICDVQGDVTIVHNGHLLTIVSTDLSQGEAIIYSIYKAADCIYKNIKVDVNGEVTDRCLYPFGKGVRLNLSMVNEVSKSELKDGGYLEVANSGDIIDYENSGALVTKEELWHASMLGVFEEARKKNYFTRPFLACVAVQLYDDTFVYLTAPTLLFPCDKYATHKIAYDKTIEQDVDVSTGAFVKGTSVVGAGTISNFPYGDGGRLGAYITNEEVVYAGQTILDGLRLVRRWSIFRSGAHSYKEGSVAIFDSGSVCLDGAKIVLSLSDMSNIIDNADVFKGISIFVSQEANIFDMSADGYKYGKIVINKGELENTRYANIAYSPRIRKDKDIIYDLLNSPFYRLIDYSIQDLRLMQNKSTIVDLSEDKLDGLLNNIAKPINLLDAEAGERVSFIPKCIYNYNSKIHLANYGRIQFHGFPIDLFQQNNKAVLVNNDTYLDGVVKGLELDPEFQFIQHPRTKTNFLNNNTEEINDKYITSAKQFGTCFAAISVTIETLNGEQKVVRYVEPYNASVFNDGDDANFVESLNPLLTFPDARAKYMNIFVVSLHEGVVTKRASSFPLTPHPYLNIAYYIDPNLKPITLPKAAGSNDIELDKFVISGGGNLFTPPEEKNNIENFPNGLKVSLANNSLFFPYETTYQVGSSEIVALMSNTVAIGTGQTGDAPLYVFCKDGIYVLIVDPSGTMTYTNQPPIARDVCNNAKSVTPIDKGVVFTSDRGLMSIAGDKVVEIGSAAEGDVFDITDTSDKAKKIMFNAFTMPQLAEFPQSLIDNTDFLTYLKGAIVNYNHNERELMVSNPDKDYTYVMDRNGNWSRRAFTAQEYVNNYPTSYRIDKTGNFYKVDADDNDTNKVYLLSNVIKLGTIAFKQAYRLVVRGYFETVAAKLGLYVFGSYDGRQWSMIGANERDGQFTDIGCKISHTDIRFLRVCIAGKLSKDTRIDYIEVSADGSALNSKLR